MFDFILIHFLFFSTVTPSLFISNGEEKEIRREKMEYECVCANARARRMHVSRERVAQAENGAIT